MPIGLSSGLAAEPFAAMGLRVPSTPRVAPDFTLPAPTAQTIRLSAYAGQVVLLNFWATWCPPCRTEMPGIQRLYTRFKERGFVVLAVSVDTAGEGTVTSFATEQGLTFPIALDAAMTVATRYSVRGLPSTVLLDRRGRIRASVVGPREWDTPAAYAAIETLLDPAANASGGAAPR
jgi:peroxiredoxin